MEKGTDEIREYIFLYHLECHITMVLFHILGSSPSGQWWAILKFPLCWMLCFRPWRLGKNSVVIPTCTLSHKWHVNWALLVCLLLSALPFRGISSYLDRKFHVTGSQNWAHTHHKGATDDPMKWGINKRGNTLHRRWVMPYKRQTEHAPKSRHLIRRHKEAIKRSRHKVKRETLNGIMPVTQRVLNGIEMNRVTIGKWV